METLPRGRFGLAVIVGSLAVLLTACGTTSIQSEWKDAAHPRFSVRKVLVVGIDHRDDVRQAFEKEFVTQLSRKGIDAVPSYREFALRDLERDQERALDRARELGIDSVFSTRLVDKKTVEKQYPREDRELDPAKYQFDPAVPYRSWTPYYTTSHHKTLGPERVTVGEDVRVESNLYDLATEELRWSALSKTFVDNRGNREKQLKAFASALIGHLSRDGVIP